MNNKPRLFLIDGHALCYRSFYAIRDLTNSRGQATNAVLGFVNILRKIMKSYSPDYIGVCFDSHVKTFRQKKFADYKIQRPKMPEDLVSQIPIIKDVVKAFNMSVFELGGYEADDIIATLSVKAPKENVDVVIVSDDKDLYQLVNEKVKIFRSSKNVLLDHKDVIEKLGFSPEKMVDFIGLAGDKSDNIPGVVGIGKVTAGKLINEHGSVEGILENIDAVMPEKVREKILAQKDSLVLSKELAVLDKDVPFHFDLDQLKVEAPDSNRLFELFTELEFRKLAEEFQQDDVAAPSISVETITDIDFDVLIAGIKSSSRFAFIFNSVVESEDSDKKSAEDASLFDNILISFDEGRAYQISISDINNLRDVFEDESILKVTYDFKSSLKIFAKNDISLLGEVFDVMIAGYLLSPARTSYKIDNMIWDYLKYSVNNQCELSVIVNAVYKLQVLLFNEMKNRSLLDLFNNIEMPLINVLYDMECHGVKLDVDFLLGLSKETDVKIKELTKHLYSVAGEEFNLNSPKQLSHVLFEKLNLPVIKKTKTGFSTNEEVLSILSKDHDFPAKILDYRQLAKLKSTYIDALPKLVDSNNTIHTQFLQTGTETGRLSCRQPNLQNIPIRTELGRQVRKAFIPSKPELLLVASDYSQIELRILAHLSKDENLINAFKADKDIHAGTASFIFDVPEDEVTSEMRYSAKRVNFGIVYGMSAFGLAKDLDVPQKEAQDFIDKYFLNFPGVKLFMEDSIKFCEENGYVSTLLDRRRLIPDILSKNNAVKQFAERQAINTPVQGTAADLIKLAMIHVQRKIVEKKLRSTMLISVHDELVFEVPKDEKDELIAMVKDVMENILELSVPIAVNIKVGLNWLEMEEVKI